MEISKIQKETNQIVQTQKATYINRDSTLNRLGKGFDEIRENKKEDLDSDEEICPKPTNVIKNIVNLEENIQKVTQTYKLF